MSVTTDIRLSRVHLPKFPHRCVHCDRSGPDGTVRLHHDGQNPLFALLFPVLWACGWSHVDAPICKECKPKFQLRRLLRTLALVAVILTARVLLGPKLAAWSIVSRPLPALGLLLAFAVSIIVFEFVRPRRFTTSTRGDAIDYQFASPHYAAEFKALNGPRRRRLEW